MTAKILLPSASILLEVSKSLETRMIAVCDEEVIKEYVKMIFEKVF